MEVQLRVIHASVLVVQPNLLQGTSLQPALRCVEIKIFF
jgi:hypothetical protein